MNIMAIKVLILKYLGRAAPYVMDDFHDYFNSCGHEALLLDFPRIKEKCKTGEEKSTILYTTMLNALSEFKPDMVMGYGATSAFALSLQSGNIINLVTMLKIPCVSIYYDNPLTPSCFDSSHPLMDSNLSYFFIWDRHYVNEFKKLGIEKSYYCPIAANIRRFKKFPRNDDDAQRFGADVSFVGSYTLKRELILRPLLDAGLDLVIWGYDWDKAADPRFRAANRGVADNQTELVKVYNYSKVNINITVDQGISSLNMRVFDCIASGGFLVSDYKSDFDELFDKDEVVTYKRNTELPGIVKYYLEHEDERIAMARKARKKVLAEHNYAKRVEFIVKTMEEEGAFDGGKWWRKLGPVNEALSQIFTLVPSGAEATEDEPSKLEIEENEYEESVSQ